MLSDTFRQKVKQKLMDLVIPLSLILLITLFIIAFWFSSVFHSIYPGQAGVFWSRFFGGTKIDRIYHEGFHVIPPWDQLYIYDVRVQEIPHIMDVLTKDGLNVHLELSIRFAPKLKLLGLLHQRVGPEYPQKIIVPEIVSVLREIIGTMHAEQIYTTGRVLIVKAINEAIEQVAQRYIDVDDVLIKTITLPESVAKAIRFKIQQKHLDEAHVYIIKREKKESERKRIEGEGIRDQLKIIAEAVPNGEILKYKGIQATEKIATSDNSKVVIIGGENGLPIILNTEK